MHSDEDGVCTSSSASPTHQWCCTTTPPQCSYLQCRRAFFTHYLFPMMQAKVGKFSTFARGI